MTINALSMVFGTRKKVTALTRCRPARGRARVAGDPRPERLWQDHIAAVRRRARGSDLRRDPYRIRGRVSKQPAPVLPPNKRDVGWSFRTTALWPHMTVRRNVEYPLKARHAPAAERSRRVSEVFALVRCTELADRLPSQLSGGQQQRVAFARGLAASPETHAVRRAAQQLGCAAPDRPPRRAAAAPRRGSVLRGSTSPTIKKRRCSSLTGWW